MNDNSSDPPLLVRMMKNFLEPATHFLNADVKYRVAKAIELMTEAGVELDRIKDAPEETIKSFFISLKMQIIIQYLSTLLCGYKCYLTVNDFLLDPTLLTQQFLVLRDSVDLDELRAVVKCAMDSMNFEDLRVLLSDESGGCGVLYFRRRFFAKEILEKIKYLYPSLYFPELFALRTFYGPCSLGDKFPFEILNKPYLRVLLQYGKCVVSHYEKNLLCKLFSEENQEMIEQMRGQKIDIGYTHDGCFVNYAVATSLECNIKFLLDMNTNFKSFLGSHTVTSLMRAKNDKIFEMLLRAIHAGVQNKYCMLYKLSEDFSDSRVKIVLAQLAVDTSKGLILNQTAYNQIELFKYKNHYEMCQEQVKWMKSVVIFKNVTLLHALDCDTVDLTKFADFKDNIQNFLAQCKEKKLIDYYYSSLEEQLCTAIAVQDIRARAVELIQRVTGLFIILTVDKIMSYLNLKDLRYFVLPVNPQI